MRKLMFLMSIFLVASTFTIIGSVQADWAHSFVVNDGKTYIISDTQVESAQIGDRIGKVTSYSDEEGTYSGNFSNHYPKGTEYYAIKDINRNEAIAIKVSEGSFVKASYGGEYAKLTAFSINKTLLYAGGMFLIIIALLFVKNNWKRS